MSESMVAEQLLLAMNDVIHAAAAKGDRGGALRRALTSIMRACGAEVAELILVLEEDPLHLETLCAGGLSESPHPTTVDLPAVSKAIKKRAQEVVAPNAGCWTLCCPVIDASSNKVLAVLYLRGGTRAPCRRRSGWLDSCAAVLGQIFSAYFEERRRETRFRSAGADHASLARGPRLVGDSEHTQALRRELHEVYIPAADAQEPDPVLIVGEKGTGKDVVARYLHAHSARQARPFVAVNCAEITDEMAAARFFGHRKGSFTGAVADETGLFRAAHRGVLFLDEIGELSLRAQATLLRVMENRAVVPVGETRETPVDVQVILATNGNLEESLQQGLLRPDFLDRFKTQAIHLRPLRERPGDIVPLVGHFQARHEQRTGKQTLGFTAEVMQEFLGYRWPGNVRELGRVCSLLLTRTKVGCMADPDLLAQCCTYVLEGQRNVQAAGTLWDDLPLRKAARLFQRDLVLSRLERHGWNLRATRKSLGLPKTSFGRYTRRLGIDLSKLRKTRRVPPDPRDGVGAEISDPAKLS